MADQTGSIKVTGRIGDMVFYFNRLAGRIVGRRVNPNFSETVKTHPSFRKFMMHAELMADASAAAGLIRKCFGEAIKGISDSEVNTRLNVRAKKVIAGAHNTTVHPFHTEAVLGLKPFSFNAQHSLCNFIASGFKTKIEATKYIATFKPTVINNLYYATRYQIGSFVMGIDFESKEFEGVNAMSKKLSIKDKIGGFKLTVEIPEGYPVYFGVIALRQFQYVNKRYSVLNNSTGHAADLMDVWIGKK